MNAQTRQPLHQPAVMPCGSSRWILISLAMALGWEVAVQGSSADDVMILDFTIHPMANVSFLDDHLVLHGKALVAAGYNTNVNTAASRDRAVGDSFYDVSAGTELRYSPSERSRLDLDADIRGQWYRKTHADDMTGGILSLRGRHDSDIWAYRGDLTVDRINDPLIQSGEIISRDDYGGDVRISRTGLRSVSTLTSAVSRTIYLQDSSDFQRQQRDFTDYQASLIHQRFYTADITYEAKLILDQVRYDQNTRYNNSLGSAFELGGARLLGVRTRGSIDAGVSWRRYGADFSHDGAYGDRNAIGPVGVAALVWPFEESSEVHLRAYAQIVDSLSSNALYVYGMTLGTRLRLAQKATAFGDLTILRLENSGAPAGDPVEIRVIAITTVGAEYYLRDGVALRSSVVYTSSTAQSVPGYTRLVATVMIACAF